MPYDPSKASLSDPSTPSSSGLPESSAPSREAAPAVVATPTNPAASVAITAPAPATAPALSAPPTDIVLLHSPTDDGKGARVLRVRNEGIEAGEIRPLEEGKPISGEILKLKPRQENERVCDVEVLMAPPAGGAASRPTSKGPAQVASPDYRDNWSRIFGSKADRDRGALN